MDKNVVWAIVLSMGILLLWQKFFAPRTEPRQSTPIESTAQVAPVTEISNSKSPQVDSAAVSVQAQTQPIREEKISTPWVQATISSRGAALKSWKVKEDLTDTQEDWVELVQDTGDFAFLPLATFAETSFQYLGQRSGTEEIQTLWRSNLGNGVELLKTIAIPNRNSSEKYFGRVELTLRNTSANTVRFSGLDIGWSNGLGTIANEQNENAKTTRALAYPSAKKEVDKFKDAENVPWTYSWLGIDNRYFLAALLPDSKDWKQAHFEKSKQNLGEAKLLTGSLDLAANESRTFTFRFYAGPKGYTWLKQLGLGLEHSIDFGMFGFLGKWALKALFRVHEWTGNYGWSIILLTLFLQALLLPLNIKSYKSMAAMKKMQPKIVDLQKRFKNDQKRLSQEMMLLYKTTGTNPFGGCLPMLLQIPIFWAFFTTLRNSVELRGAPWAFWIHDLSQKDPFYALPIIMGAGMFLQQKISGSAGMDPKQAKLMMFLPIIFTFMFLQFPSGLVLYWITNSLVAMVIQFYITRSQQATA